MTATDRTVGSPAAGGHPHRTDDLHALARNHLWGHFTRLANITPATFPVIVGGEGCYVWDTNGKRYLDGFSSLFVKQIGHGRRELGSAARQQSDALASWPVWSFGNEPAIRLAARLAELAPGDLSRVFFTASGGEAVEAAWKLAIQYHTANGEHRRHKVISRDIAYHGMTMGALSLTGVAAYRAPFEPLVPGAIKVMNTNRYRCPDCSHLDGCTLRCARDIEQRILMEGPETVAAVFLEPLQNAGGAFVPPPGYWANVREICDRYGVLLVSDEVICGFGRLGEMFGSQHYGYVPDIITFAKGVTSGYAPMGGAIVSDRIAQPFLDDPRRAFLHGATFGGHPVSCAVALANLDILEGEGVIAAARQRTPVLAEMLQSLRSVPIVGDVRGDGYFWAIELVKDPATKTSFSDEDGEHLLRGFLSPRFEELGLLCRTDDRGDPVVILAPPLVADEPVLEHLHAMLQSALGDAADEMARRARTG